jgi:ribosomal protein S18 acetylase RimI-like enzyme
MDIKRAVDFVDTVRESLSEMFIDGHSKELRLLSNDIPKLKKAFSHMFVLDYFYLAVIDNEIAGMAVCIDTENQCRIPDGKILRNYFGIIKGTLANTIFRLFFTKRQKYPKEAEVDERTGSIEAVATHVKYRKRGVASALLNHILASSIYDDHVLEVVGSNTVALKLYHKLGFQEICRKKRLLGRFFGVNSVVYMKRLKRA